MIILEFTLNYQKKSIKICLLERSFGKNGQFRYTLIIHFVTINIGN